MCGLFKELRQYLHDFWECLVHPNKECENERGNIKN